MSRRLLAASTALAAYLTGAAMDEAQAAPAPASSHPVPRATKGKVNKTEDSGVRFDRMIAEARRLEASIGSFPKAQIERCMEQCRGCLARVDAEFNGIAQGELGKVLGNLCDGSSMREGCRERAFEMFGDERDVIVFAKHRNACLRRIEACLRESNGVRIFDANIIDRELAKGITIVIFYSSAHEGSKAILPAAVTLARKYGGQVKVGQIDVQKNRRLRKKFAITELPTIVVYQDGEELLKMDGDFDEAGILREIDDLFQTSQPQRNPRRIIPLDPDQPVLGI